MLGVPDGARLKAPDFSEEGAPDIEVDELNATWDERLPPETTYAPGAEREESAKVKS